MSDEKKDKTLWRLEDQKWWQEYVAKMKQPTVLSGNGSAVPVNGSGSAGSGLFIYSSNVYGSGSNGSGLYIMTSGSNVYGSGLYIMSSGSYVYGSGSGLYIMSSGSAVYGSGSGLYIQGSNAAVYGTAAMQQEANTCTVDMSKVLIPEYLREAALKSANAANNASGVLAYGLDLI
ncbi:MAG: hypothetical protein KBT01_04370 [Clostridiales bacterium]|nr:hypothetical protein [Candidatus Blautia equi]